VAKDLILYRKNQPG